MGEWDCEICGKAYSQMLTPVEFNHKTFCGKECLAEYKTKHHRIKKANRPKYNYPRRDASMGVWRKEDKCLWEDYA